MRWTKVEDEFMRRNANRGVVWLRREMHRRFGKARSVSAIKSHASRMGMSLSRYGAEECPECHREFSKLIANTGLCRECTIRQTRDRQAERKRRIQANDAAVHGREVAAMAREADTLRQWNHKHSR